MPADTSSAAAGGSTTVVVVAAALAALIVEPILATSEAATVTNSGAAIRKDIPNLPIGLRAPGTLGVEHSADAQRNATHTQSVTFHHECLCGLFPVPTPCPQSAHSYR